MDDHQVEAASLRLGKWIFGVLAAGAAVIVVAFGTTHFVAARVPVAYLLLAILGLEIFLVTEFSRRGPARAPIIPLLAGWAFALGGIALDVAMTVAKTPNLDAESNVIARAFLDSGYSVWHVRVFGFIAQGGLAVLACLAWSAFLRHRGTVIALTRALGPRTYREFTNAAIRGVLRPKPLISRSGITLPRFNWYRVGCLAMVVWVGSHLYRWYCGLDWLGLVPSRQLWVSVATASAGAVYFYLWLWVEYRKCPKPVLEPSPSPLGHDGGTR
jgi:hypothetical protein